MSNLISSYTFREHRDFIRNMEGLSPTQVPGPKSIDDVGRLLSQKYPCSQDPVKLPAVLPIDMCGFVDVASSCYNSITLHESYLTQYLSEVEFVMVCCWMASLKTMLAREKYCHTMLPGLDLLARSLPPGLEVPSPVALGIEALGAVMTANGDVAVPWIVTPIVSNTFQREAVELLPAGSKLSDKPASIEYVDLMVPFIYYRDLICFGGSKDTGPAYPTSTSKAYVGSVANIFLEKTRSARPNIDLAPPTGAVCARLARTFAATSGVMKSVCFSNEVLLRYSRFIKLARSVIGMHPYDPSPEGTVAVLPISYNGDQPLSGRANYFVYRTPYAVDRHAQNIARLFRYRWVKREACNVVRGRTSKVKAAKLPISEKDEEIEDKMVVDYIQKDAPLQVENFDTQSGMLVLDHVRASWCTDEMYFPEIKDIRLVTNHYISLFIKT